MTAKGNVMSTPVPVPSLNIGSAEQTGAELLAYVIVKGGSTNADKLARALILEQAATIFTDAASGDVAALNSELAALSSKVTDPGLKVVIGSVISWATPFIDAELALAKGMVGVGSLLDGALTAGAAGFNKVASAYIAAYGTKPAA